MQISQDVLAQSTPANYSVVVEDSPVDANYAYPCQGRNGTSMFRIRVSTIMALTMAILGSSVVPVSSAFATTGITCGLLISLVRTHCIPVPATPKTRFLTASCVLLGTRTLLVSHH